MKIELKKLKVNLTFSEETIMFQTEIHVDGKRVGVANNDGHGGCTFCHWYDANTKDEFIKLEEWCKTLPSEIHEIGGRTITIDSNLENLVDTMVDDHVNKMEQKRFETKMKKKMLTGLILSKDGGKSYSSVTWKNNTIEGMLKNPNGIAMLKKTIEKYTNEGYQILNTNLNF